MIANPDSLRMVAEYAKKTPANASPTSTSTGSASTTPTADVNTPNGAITSRNTALVVATRNVTNNRCAATTSGTASGVPTIAKYVRCHFRLPSTGQVVSPVAICMAWAAARPGATNARYEGAPSKRLADAST